MKLADLFESSRAKKFDSQLLRVSNDPSVWGSESGFTDFAKKHGYEVETASDFLYATHADRYFGFYDRYAGDGLLLDYNKHKGFGSRNECLDVLVDSYSQPQTKDLLMEHVWFDSTNIKKFATLALSVPHQREDKIEFEGTKFICTMVGKNSIHWRMLENTYVPLRPSTYIAVNNGGKEAGTAEVSLIPSRRDNTKVYVYDPKLYLKTRLNLEDMSHDKVIKNILILYKNYASERSNTEKTNYFKKILTVARQAGYKSPELDAIYKSFKSHESR